MLEAAEAEKVLEVLYQCLDNPKAVQCYRLLKGRRVTQSSFAYDILDAGWAKRTDPATGKEYEVYELRKLHIIEVGPTLVGANQETELLAVKSAELTRALGRGRTISPKSLDQLVAAHESIGQLIESAKADDAKTSGRAPDAAPAADATHTGQPDAETASDERGDGAAKSSAQSSADRPPRCERGSPCRSPRKAAAHEHSGTAQGEEVSRRRARQARSRLHRRRARGGDDPRNRDQGARGEARQDGRRERCAQGHRARRVEVRRPRGGRHRCDQPAAGRRQDPRPRRARRGPELR
ncbi:hypothetical protein GS531_10785 [Rhodococcus hoagii]|nr:hypothetical protein [Prescottella equi]